MTPPQPEYLCRKGHPSLMWSPSCQAGRVGFEPTFLGMEPNTVTMCLYVYDLGTGRPVRNIINCKLFLPRC